MTRNRSILALVAVLAIAVRRLSSPTTRSCAATTWRRCAPDLRPERGGRVASADAASDRRDRSATAPAPRPVTGVAGDVDRRRPAARPAIASASSSPTFGRIGRRRADDRRDGLASRSRRPATAPTDSGHARSRHDHDHLGREPPRQPAPHRGPPDRPVPDGHVHADPAGRRPGRGTRRHGDRRDARSAT